MKAHVDNLRLGRWKHGGWLVIPVVALVLGSAGVVLGPGRAFKLAEARVSVARSHEESSQREWAQRLEYRRAGGDRILLDVDALIEGALPPAPSQLEIHTALKLIAARRDLDLRSIGAGAEPEAVDPELAPNVVRQRVELRAGATLDAWKGVVADLRALGYPTAVLGFSFVRGKASDARFEGHVELDLFHARATQAERLDARNQR